MRHWLPVSASQTRTCLAPQAEQHTVLQAGPFRRTWFTAIVGSKHTVCASELPQRHQIEWDAMEEYDLVRKLVRTWHLNVPERRALPNPKVRASIMCQVIAEDLRETGWHPEPLDDLSEEGEGDRSGGTIQLLPDGSCKIHWQGQVGVSRFERFPSTRHEDATTAARVLLWSYFGSIGHIDGILIDWDV